MRRPENWENRENKKPRKRENREKPRNKKQKMLENAENSTGFCVFAVFLATFDCLSTTKACKPPTYNQILHIVYHLKWSTWPGIHTTYWRANLFILYHFVYFLILFPCFSTFPIFLFRFSALVMQLRPSPNAPLPTPFFCAYLRKWQNHVHTFSVRVWAWNNP